MQVLVVDGEFLVALEAEQVLADSLGLKVEIAMPRISASTIREGRHDIVIVDAALVLDNRRDLASALRGSDAAIIFWSFDNEHLHGLPSWDGIPVISKPFDDEILVGVVRNVAAR